MASRAEFATPRRGGQDRRLPQQAKKAGVDCDDNALTARYAAVIICAGIIVGVLHQTGLGVKATSLMLSLSDGRLWPAHVQLDLGALAAALKVGIGVALLSCAFVGTGGAPWKRLGALIGGTVSILALPL